MKREVVKFTAWAVVAGISGLAVAYGYIRSMEEGHSDRWQYSHMVVMDLATRLAECQDSAPPTPKEVVRMLTHPDDE